MLFKLKADSITISCRILSQFFVLLKKVAFFHVAFNLIKEHRFLFVCYCCCFVHSKASVFPQLPLLFFSAITRYFDLFFFLKIVRSFVHPNAISDMSVLGTLFQLQWPDRCNSIFPFSFQYHRALLVLRQCHQLRPEDSLVCLYAAKLCFNNLHMVNYAQLFLSRL